MKGHIRAGLIAIATWSMALFVIGTGLTVCSSCGVAKPAPSVSCQAR